MPFKLQINSLEALNRLLGDPPAEMMVEIRGSIIQEFARTHIKTIADEEISAIKSAARESATEIATKTLGEYARSEKWPFAPYLHLKEDIQKSIKVKIQEELGREIQEELSRYLDNKDIDSMISKTIDRRVNMLIDERVRDGVRKRWAELQKLVEDDQKAGN